MSKKTHYTEVIEILQELHKDFPTYNIGRHLATALADYGDTWGLTDKEFAFALSKYKSEIEMDVPHTDESELEKIIKEGMDLDNILKEEEEEDESLTPLEDSLSSLLSALETSEDKDSIYKSVDFLFGSGWKLRSFFSNRVKFWNCSGIHTEPEPIDHRFEHLRQVL